MSKVKSLDKSLYPSIYDAVYEIMDKHLLVAADNPIYHAKALEEVCFFLAENDIKHQYTIIPAPAGAVKEFPSVRNVGKYLLHLGTKPIR